MPTRTGSNRTNNRDYWAGLRAWGDQWLRNEGQRQTAARSDNTRVRPANSVRTRRMADVAAERAVRNRQARRADPHYDERKARHDTRVAVLQAQKPDAVSKTLNFAADVASGVGLAADAISHVPVYSSLKAAKSFGDAVNNRSLGSAAEGLMWSLPLAGGVWATRAGQLFSEIGAATETAFERLRNTGNSLKAIGRRRYNNGDFIRQYPNVVNP